MFYNALVKKILKLSQEFTCATLMAFIEDSTPQKITAKILSVGLFCGAGFNKRREKNYKEKKKR